VVEGGCDSFVLVLFDEERRRMRQVLSMLYSHAERRGCRDRTVFETEKQFRFN